MKCVETALTYKVPSWNYCNLDGLLVSTAAKCRFCVKQGKTFVCALHDAPLAADDKMVRKCSKCVSVTSGGADTEPDLPQVDPVKLIASTIDAYEKQLSALLAAGYPRDIAATVAKKYLTGGQ